MINFFQKHKPIQPGLTHAVVREGDAVTRLHLRIEPDGRGILSINASKILHLNPTAAEIVKRHLDNEEVDSILTAMHRRYRVRKEFLREDIAKTLETIRVLTATDQVCPITYLDTEAVPPFQYASTAPLRMDLALTYRCNVGCAHCYNLAGRQSPELPAAEWKKAFRLLWEAGVPHLTFTGGEPTLRDDLPELVQAAEELGFITGLQTNGRRLADREFVRALKECGLDHVQVTLESHREGVHDAMVGAAGAFDQTVQGIRNCLAEGLYTITNTTLTAKNAPGIAGTVGFIASLGLKTFACNGIIHTGSGPQKELELDNAALTAALETVKRAAQTYMLRFIWYTPTQYCEVHPVELGVGLKQCSAAKYAMCVEPNGDVLPCQSWYRPVGNLLKDPWPAIWDHPLCQSIRDRSYLMEKCYSCADLELCGGGCPLYLEHKVLYCKEGASGS
jgi:radical SAM protein with 4Fe4S-binding SPASM domain